MKQAINLIAGVVGIILFGLLLNATFSAMSRAQSGGVSTEIPSNSPSPGFLPSPEATGTPLPYPYPSPPQITWTPYPTHSFAEVTAAMATRDAEMTAVAPTPYDGGLVVQDPSGQFTVTLLEGWEAQPSGQSLYITNYMDVLTDVNTFPPGALKISVAIGQLPEGQSFEQWLDGWIIAETAPTDDWRGQTATEPTPYLLGNYQGIAYFLGGPPGTFEVLLPLTDRRVISVQMTPSDSPAIEDGILMLSSIEVAPPPTP